MANIIELLQTKVKVLEKGEYNLRTAELAIASIFKEIEASNVTWEEISTSKTELDKCFFEILKKEFLQLFAKYLRAEVDLEELEYHFCFIDSGIQRSQLSFSELNPFNAEWYFKFRSFFSNQEDHNN
ncbi:hypothetical protein ACFL2U_02905 [Patescibacteria group bacterium]